MIEATQTKKLKLGRPSRRMIVFWSCFALFILYTWLAFTQPPRPDPFQPIFYDTWDGWRYPLERNAFKRLSYTNADLVDVFAVPDTDYVWALGNNAVLLHSDDGGQTWHVQPVEELAEASQGALDPARPKEMKNSSSFATLKDPQKTSQWSPFTLQAAFAGSDKLPSRQEPGRVLENDAAGVQKHVNTKPLQFLGEKMVENFQSRQVNLERTDAVLAELDRMMASFVQSLWFASANQGWARLKEDRVVLTEDGRTWHPIQPDLPFAQIYFSADGRQGWAVEPDGAVFYSTDSGQSWEPWMSGDNRTLIVKIHFLPDGSKGWGVSLDGRLFTVEHQNRRWLEHPTGHDLPLTALSFSDDGHLGWLTCEDGTILFSDDFGASWSVQARPEAVRLNAVRFDPDGNRGWVVGDQGVIFNTTDGGWTWHRQTEGPSGRLHAIHFSADRRLGWAVGGNGRILHTRNGGRTWKIQASGIVQNLNVLCFAQEDRIGWVGGQNGTLLHTDDGGRTWQIRPTGFEATIHDLWFMADGRKGWAALEDGRVMYTVDGGRSWIEQSSSKQALLALFFQEDGRKGWVVGAGPRLGFTVNGGEQWTWVTVKNAQALHEIWFDVTGRRGWAVGDNGQIFHSQDGGRKWQAKNSDTDAQLRSVAFTPNGDQGWAVGSDGTLVTIQDQAGQWIAQPMAAAVQLNQVQFHPESGRIWIVGHGSTILVSDNNGQQWYDPAAAYQRYPSVWYYLFWILLAVFLVPAFQRPKPLVAEKDSVADTGTSDRPLEADDPDPLHFKSIARALSGFFRNENTEPSLTIAITGQWGTGKSSLMNLLKSDLENYGFRPTWFNAWHHQREDNMLAALLENIQGQSTPSLWHFQGWIFRFRLSLMRGKRHWLPMLAMMLMASILCGYFMRHAPTSIDDAERRLRELVFGRTIYVVNDKTLLAAESFIKDQDIDMERLSELKGRPFAQPEAFIGELENIIPPGEARDKIVAASKTTKNHWEKLILLMGFLGSVLMPLYRWLVAFGIKPSDLMASVTSRSRSSDVRAQLGFRQKYKQIFCTVTQALHPRTMVIFIDDLDRCLPRNVLKVLEAVNYLAISGRCFIVMGMDTMWVTRCVGLGFRRVAEEVMDDPAKAQKPSDTPEAKARRLRREFARQYLEKLINIEVPVPRLSLEQSSKLMVPKQQDKPQSIGWRQLYIEPVLNLFVSFWRTVLPMLVVLTIVGGGIWLGWTRHFSTVESVLVADPIVTELTQKTAQDRISDQVQPSNAEAIQDSLQAQADQETAFFKPAESNPISRQFIIWPLVALVAVFFYIWLRQPQVIVKDSPDFASALRIWHPVVASVHHTPRSIKRYMNRLRYFAMRLRGFPSKPPRNGLLTRLFSLFQRTKPEKNTLAETDILSEPNLVALAALHYNGVNLMICESLFQRPAAELQPEDFAGVTAERAALLKQTLVQHQHQFDYVWPPSPEARQSFLNLVEQVKMI